MSNYASYPSLKDKVVFVSGGGSGIGASIVEHFCEQGSVVGFVDIDVASSEKLVADMGAKGYPVPTFYECDITDTPAYQAVIKDFMAKNGPITGLINNAAHDERHAIDDMTPEYWDGRIAVNIKHQFFATQACHNEMAEAGGGSIVNMGSVSWMVGQGGMPAYTASKSGIVGLTRGLARDLGPKNIRVNSVVPGWTMTQRQIDLWLNEESEAELMQNQTLKEKVYPDDIARMVLFMVADDSRHCSNQNYIVDGGWC